MEDIAQPGGSAPGLVARAKVILTAPTTEWPKIASETDSVRSVFISYVVPLAAIGPIFGFIGGQLFGVGAFGFRYHPTLIGGLASAITAYVLALVSIFLIAWVANFLADKFGGQQNFERAFKLCAHALTAGWVAGVFNLLTSLSLLVFLVSLYGIYLFYLGATPMMAVPQDKAAGYTAVTIVGVIIVGIIIAAVTAPIAAVFAPATAIGASADNGTVEMSVPGYGKVKVENNGNKQTLEVPGYGTVHVTKNGDTVKIDGPNVNAEVKDTDAGK
ncbi:MAG: Yip1 family protein [Croceibacterium sp.]